MSAHTPRVRIGCRPPAECPYGPGRWSSRFRPACARRREPDAPRRAPPWRAPRGRYRARGWSAVPFVDSAQFGGSERTRPTLPRKGQTKHAVRRSGIDVNAKLLAALLDDVPRPIVRLEAELGDLGDVRENAGS